MKFFAALVTTVLLLPSMASATEICNGDHKKVITYTGGQASVEYLSADGENHVFGLLDSSGEYIFRIQHPMQDDGMVLTYPLRFGQLKMSWHGGLVKIHLINEGQEAHVYEYTCSE